VKVGDLVKYHDELYAGLGLVINIANHPRPAAVDFVCVQYNDVTDWIDIEDLEIVNASG
jgi:hypothetical protein|tara:strand:+ start:37997 stop:38173 length:177 start_codon:yes stop_codon:yes gene_type:complete